MSTKLVPASSINPWMDALALPSPINARKGFHCSLLLLLIDIVTLLCIVAI
jgi:hypothetical protein